MELVHTKSLSQRTIAIITGASIILMAVLAGIVFGGIFNPIFALEAEELQQAISSSETAFRYGILGWIAILLCDIIAAWGFYAIYKQKNKNVSLLTAWLRLVYTAILAGAILCLVLMLHVATHPGILTFNDIAALLVLFKNGFQGAFSFGLLIFGFHLLGLGYLVFEKKPLFITLSALLIVAGIGYIITNTCNFAFPNYQQDYKATLEAIFMLPMVLSEVGLAIWLIAKGGKKAS